jgi:hypothetical protein
MVGPIHRFVPAATCELTLAEAMPSFMPVRKRMGSGKWPGAVMPGQTPVMTALYGALRTGSMAAAGRILRPA